MENRKELFLTELAELLKKHRVEIELEECGSGYNVDHRIIADFEREEEGTPDTIHFGNFIDAEHCVCIK